MNSQKVNPYIKTLQKINSEQESLIIIKGESDFLKQYACLEIEKELVKKKSKLTTLNTNKKSEGEIAELIQQSSLFAEKNHYVVESFDENKAFLSFLGSIKDKESLLNSLVLISKSKQLSAQAQKALKNLEALHIHCDTPKGQEYNAFTAFLASSKGLNLDKGAIFFLLDQMGQDLVKINNELNKFSLLFPKNKKTLTIEDISQYSNFLKQEQVFQITKFLLEKKIAQAQNIISNLLQNQEQALSIIGILAFFCRTALYLKDLKAKGIQADSSKVRLPSFIVNHYNRNVDRHSEASLNLALKECAQCDILLKTKGKRDPFVLVSKIITRLE